MRERLTLHFELKLKAMTPEINTHARIHNSGPHSSKGFMTNFLHKSIQIRLIQQSNS